MLHDIYLFRWFLSVSTLSEICAGDAHLIVLHCINTIIYTNMYHTALPLLTLTIPPPSLPLLTPHLFHLTPPPHILYLVILR